MKVNILSENAEYRRRLTFSFIRKQEEVSMLSENSEYRRPFNFTYHQKATKGKYIIGKCRISPTLGSLCHQKITRGKYIVRIIKNIADLLTFPITRKQQEVNLSSGKAEYRRFLTLRITRKQEVNI